MKKATWLLLIFGLFFLVACGKQEEKKETAPKEEQVVKTQAFELEMANGQKQKQTVVYKGDTIQKVTLKNVLPPTEEITNAIAEVGFEETKRLLGESMNEDPAYQALNEVKGLSYELQSGDNNELFLIFNLNVPDLDTEALGKSDIFKGSGLEDLDDLTAEQYLKRLETYGAQPVQP